MVDVPFGWGDVAEGFDEENPLLYAGIGHKPPDDPGGDDQVIAGAVAEVAELGFEDAGAIVDEQGVVSLGLFVIVGHRLGGAGQVENDVVVAE